MRRAILVFLLLVGMTAAGYVTIERARVESRNKAVDVVFDYAEVEQIAAATDKTPTDVLKAFRRAGGTSVAISERTFADALDSLEIVPVDGRRFRIQTGYPDGYAVARRLRTVLPPGLPVRYDGPPSHVFARRPGTITLGQRVPLQYLRQLPVGLPERAVADARAAGVDVVARLVNYQGAAPRAIEATLRDLRRREIQTVVFSGDQVLGFRGAVEGTADALIRHGIYYGLVEFAKQKGDLELAENASANVLVVHSIAQNEMPTLSAPEIEERFAKAVRERNVRICYVRMYDTASANLLESNVDYVSRIVGAIQRAGYVPKPAHVFDKVGAPRWTRLLTAVGVAAGVVLLVLVVVNLSTTAFGSLSVLAIAACVGLTASGDVGRKAVALLAAFVFPTLAALHATRGAPRAPVRIRHPLARAVWRVLVATITVVAGGILVVGLLSERQFMLRIDQFMGVKVAHLLPIVLLALLHGGGIAWKSDKWQAQKRRWSKSISDIAVNPILMWQAAVLAAMVVVVGVMVMRSGNEGFGVSGLELKFRALLDRALMVRPRTKELIGYPFLLIGVAFALRGRREWAAPLVTLGTIALVSALNSFCHIHTPLLVTGLRVVNGLILGLLIGALVYWPVRFVPGREK